MASQPLQISPPGAGSFRSNSTPRISEAGVVSQAESTSVAGPTASSQTLLANDNLQELEAAAVAALSLLRSYWMHLEPVIREGLLKQTHVSLSPDEWEDDPFSLSLDSYQTMLRSLVQLRPKKRPNLTVSDNGNILAAWRDDHTRVVLEFLPKDRMRWLISVDDEENVNRASGETSVPNLAAICDFHHGRPAIDG